MANNVGGGQDYLNGYGYIYKPGGVDYYSYNAQGKTPVTREIFQSNTSRYGTNVGQIEAGAPKIAEPVTTARPPGGGGGGGSSTGNVYVPPLNVDAIYKSATGRAAGQAGTWYQQNLDNYVKILDQRKSIESNILTTTQKDLEQQLKNLVEGNVITRGRTTEDTAYNLGRIGTEEGARQTTEARQFDLARRGLQSQQGEAGIATSGMGKQQQIQANFDRKMAEEKQARDVTDQKRVQELGLDRTFQDLALAEKHKGIATEFGKQKAQLSFDQAMGQLADEEFKYRQDLEGKKAAMQSDVEKSLKIQDWLNYYQGLTQEQQYGAKQKYGGFFYQ